MLAMLLRCHHCGQEFPGGVSVRTYFVRGGPLGGVIYECPHCGTREAYLPAEHHLVDLRGFAAVPRPPVPPPAVPAPAPQPTTSPAYR